MPPIEPTSNEERIDWIREEEERFLNEPTIGEDESFDEFNSNDSDE